MFRSVAITSVKTASSNDPQVICTRAIRGAVSFKMLNMVSAAAVRPECIYSVPYALAPGPWKPGDLLLDSAQVDATGQSPPGVTYKIMLAMVDEGFWVLMCYNPRISYNLRDNINILVTTEGITSLGTRTETTSVLYTNEVCRIQPTSTNWSVAHGRIGDKKTFDVFLQAQYDLQPSKHLVTWTDSAGTYLADIINVTKRNDIDDLMTLTVEVRPGETGTT